MDISKLAGHERGRKAGTHVLSDGMIVAERADPKRVRPIEPDVPSKMGEVRLDHEVWARFAKTATVPRALSHPRGDPIVRPIRP